MIQRGVFYPYCRAAFFRHANPLPPEHRSVFHEQTPAVQPGHGIYLRGSGVENFFCCGGAPGVVCCQQFVQMGLRILAGEDNIPRLLVNHSGGIRIISIEFHRGTGYDVDRIPELDTLVRSSRERNRITTASGIDTPQPVCSVFNLRILFKQNGIVVPDIQITVAENRAAIGGSRVPAERHSPVPAQRYRAVAIPINRAAVVGSPVPAERHAPVPAQLYRAISPPINRAAVVGSHVLAERHTLVVGQRYRAAINRAAVVGSPVPAKRHAPVRAQPYRAVLSPINRAAVGGSRVPAERHAPVPAQPYRAVILPINRAAPGVGGGGESYVLKRDSFIVPVASSICPTRGDCHGIHHWSVMPHELQRAVGIKLQDCICPESGAGLSGIEIQRSCVVAGVQRQRIAVFIQQTGDTREKCISLTISHSAVGKEEKRIAVQL